MTQTPLDPATTAPLVLDYQPGIVDRLPHPDPDAQPARGREVLDLARTHGLTVGFVRVGLSDEGAAGVPSAPTPTPTSRPS
ncbi:cysteine hydrolase family protein [Nocardioides acrostichi]|uniref:Isochorismatase family protein n=1 Tax=Nocardioides acrostichi TaxID=2784339 RepID=A0A930UY98_9ACTN|nr:hypothetical protein [Nocardioides acrostichi]MBF4162326.1 hypothetical protein [Nocardioides acrostichi]